MRFGKPVFFGWLVLFAGYLFCHLLCGSFFRGTENGTVEPVFDRGGIQDKGNEGGIWKAFSLFFRLPI